MLPVGAAVPGRGFPRKDNVTRNPRSNVAVASGAFPWHQAAVVLAVAVAIRVLYWLTASRSLFLQTPVVDASFFDLWARALVEGHVFQAQAFFKPPLAAWVLAALGRPNVLIALPVLGVWLWREGRKGRRPGWRGLLPVIAGCVVAIAPASLHNLRYGEFVPISANLGVNLLTGNSDQADGISAIPVGVRWDGLQFEARQRGAATPGAFSALMTRDALHWIVTHPGRELQLLGRKLVLLVNAGEGRNNINPRWLAEQEGMFVLSRWWPGTWLLLPLAVCGLVFCPREPRANLLRWLLVVQAAAAVMFVVANVDWFGLRQDRWLAPDHFNLALIHSRAYGGRQPDLEQAGFHFRRPLALYPRSHRSDLNQGLCRLWQGELASLRIAAPQRFQSIGTTP